jgi:hypothetical protein
VSSSSGDASETVMPCFAFFLPGKHEAWNHKIEEIRAVVLKLYDYRKQYEEKEQQGRLNLRKTVNDLKILRSNSKSSRRPFQCKNIRARRFKRLN